MFKTVGACLLSLVPSLALAAGPVMGPDYDGERIRSFTVAGLHLGMPSEETSDILKGAGFEGTFPKFTGTERSASLWVQVDRKVAPFRYLAKDGKVRIFEIIFEQDFDRPQSIQTLKELVVAKYGTPSETAIYGDQGGKLTYRAHFTVNHSLVEAECVERNIYEECSHGERKALEIESVQPIMNVSLTPTRLHAEISDMASLNEGEAAAKAAADAARESKALANSKNTKLGL